MTIKSLAGEPGLIKGSQDRIMIFFSFKVENLWAWHANHVQAAYKYIYINMS